ncbi:MAG: Uncharacterised protein [Hyphomonas sp. TMED17]|nr:MAG: Uncharacterised protein [Hyphomonas sp. TMED17]
MADFTSILIPACRLDSVTGTGAINQYAFLANCGPRFFEAGINRLI